MQHTITKKFYFTKNSLQRDEAQQFEIYYIYV